MNSVIFRYPSDYCPDCKARLKVHRTYIRPVKRVNVEFSAVHRIMKCPLDGTLFRSGILDEIIPPRCSYANDMMVECAVERFLKGMSGSEISSSLGISESHARKLSNAALEIQQRIHGESISKLKSSMKSYILQIDGTTDSEFSMIVVVRDAISDFTLYSKKCDSESESSIREVLQCVKDQFGTPSGITCDMRAGIISAAQNVFPDRPIRICLMHFLRDLGKDLLRDMHTVLGIMINRQGIKSPLKAILRKMPDYDQTTLDEIHNGFCTHREKAEGMILRKTLTSLLSANGSSGYGFPFSMRHLNFFTGCEEAMNKLSSLSAKLKHSRDILSGITGCLSKVTENANIRGIALKLRDINSLIFQKIRKAFKIPHSGNLSEDQYFPIRDDPIVREQCTIVFGELEIYLSSNIENHMFSAIKLAVERYRKREEMLFSQNSEGTIPRTNNNMEIFFRKIRRNVRKRSGNTATGNILAQSGEKLALFQNVGNANYMGIVFGHTDIHSVFGRYRKQAKREGMARKEIMEMVDKGEELIRNDELSHTPYTDELWAKARGSQS